MKNKVSKMKSKVENQKPFDVLMNEHFTYFTFHFYLLFYYQCC